ncbi:nicotinate-nucleotide diphosphorylase (carboxylating) [Marivirga tractuosa]|uniref:nicotinate-nucleotide diphosphorylase (carboxylating) n=1 Tax=Marivirga tractuosa (strain ATCC 23168 / DSM 4126 / NBRC 15989 / NCIMB 1408 / VKM B-1430 / H-43) TaxID=643867 RepID=E4TLN0_MARTH|nr:carboxylating nicotinate-nucleotide diphosphorylase [Marivirga tractuosa]ADR22334.1 nicotinate-nucleotide pyrophosphorylase (carboxylating) [Marivirga tractuosa DSM 4126]BDD13199.1 nicotinate-nucleotide diphosphorylase (carboxylating) [Marivirga tractuosa]
MAYQYLTKENIQKFIQSALAEDIREGDHSSLASIPAGTQNTAQLIIKGDGILAGMEMAEHIFKAVDEKLEIDFFKKDGDKVTSGEIGLKVHGSAVSILSAERLVLNCLQRMSGIATYTHNLNELIKHTSTKLLDTRKTTPNFRIAEKWAVAIGGGQNHRFGLFDMVMLKDNHNDFAGGITKAVESTQEYLKQNNLDLRIEVETRNLDEVKEALAVGGVDVIMLDNMDIPEMKQAVEIINGKCETEASGGITEDTIKAIAETGVDYISVGALTHSYKSLDMSLKAVS